MSRTAVSAVFAPFAAWALALCAAVASAQPVNSPEQMNRAVGSYVYVMDKAGHKVLVSTKFWRNDPKYDDRAFHRFMDVLAALEKRGFRLDEKAVIQNWDGQRPFARCFIYLEDLQAGTTTKTAIASGTRVWCSEAGASELEVKTSDGPKHVDQVLQRFDSILDRAKNALKK
jgi:hypothetical protein